MMGFRVKAIRFGVLVSVIVGGLSIIHIWGFPEEVEFDSDEVIEYRLADLSKELKGDGFND